MSSSNKEIISMLETLVKIQKESSKVISNLKSEVDKISEYVNIINLKVADLSSKADVNNILFNSVTSATKKAGQTSVVKNTNVMTYFKNLFKSDKEALYPLIPEDDIKEFVNKQTPLLKAKNKTKDALETALASAAYKHFVNDSANPDEIKKKLKSIKAASEASNIEITSEVAEREISDADADDSDEESVQKEYPKESKAKKVEKKVVKVEKKTEKKTEKQESESEEDSESD